MDDKPKTSGLAIVALIFTFLCLPLGLVLGIIALVQIGRSEGQLTGKGLALASVIISGCLVPIIGVFAAVAIPNFARYALRSKASEARLYLGRIRTAQEVFHADTGRYVRVPPTLASPSVHRQAWPVVPCDPACTETPTQCASFECLGFRPEGETYYAYACEITDDGQHYTCAALGDLDANEEYGLFVYGTGQGDELFAPTPDFDGLSPGCFNGLPGEIVDCAPGTY